MIFVPTQGLLVVNNKRQGIFICITLVVAAAIAWWSGHEESKVSTHVQEEVVKLVPLFHNNPNVAEDFVVDPILETTLVHSLEEVYSRALGFNGNYDVVVTRGDNELYGDGTATHVAVFQINQKPVAGLRIICSSTTESVLVAGVWVQ